MTVRQTVGRAALVAALLGGAAHAERVAIPGTDVTVEVPVGFVRMPADILKLKYSRGRPPALVYSTPGPHWEVNVAFDRREVQVPGGLPQVQAALEASVRPVPGFRWVSHGIRTVNGRDWVVLQFWANGLDTPIFNDLRALGVPGGVLIVSANVTKAQYPKYAAILGAALDSLR